MPITIDMVGSSVRSGHHERQSWKYSAVGGESGSGTRQAWAVREDTDRQERWRQHELQAEGRQREWSGGAEDLLEHISSPDELAWGLGSRGRLSVTDAGTAVDSEWGREMAEAWVLGPHSGR